MKYVLNVCSPFAQGIKSLIEDFARRGQPLIFHNLKPSVVAIFKGVKPSDLRYCSSEVELNDFLKGKTLSLQQKKMNIIFTIHALGSI